MEKVYVAYMDSPMGPFAWKGDEEAIISAGFVKERGLDTPDAPAYVEEARRQLGEYFEGRRTSFDLPLRAEGTAFQREVWAEMCRIPHGETRSYGQVARAIGRPGAARAVGQACRCNPIGLIQPCHRVIGSSGDLVGFGGQSKDLKLKRALIDHEAGRGAPTLRDF